jgi:hypothetical protein
MMHTDTMGTYGNYYLKRTTIAMIGLDANQPEDAVYPLNIGDSDGKPLDGAHTLWQDHGILPRGPC